MQSNRVKDELANDRVVYGSWLALASPAVAEIMAHAGHDFLMIDGEHSPASNETIQAMMQAMSGTTCVPFVRVAANDPVRIKQALDLGAAGLIIPMVNSREEAVAAVRACRYPPAGIRGVAASRPSGWGVNMAEYLRRANDHVCVAVQIEHPDAVDRVDEILGVEGIDVAYVGLADLVALMGFGDAMANPPADVEEALARVVATARRVGVPLGIHCVDAESAARRVRQGFTFVAIGGDGRYVGSTARATLSDLKRLVATE